MLTIMHVAVSLCGIQLDGLQEVPLRFCFLPLRDRLNTMSLVSTASRNYLLHTYTTLNSKVRIPLCMSHPKPHTYFSNNNKS